MPKKPAVAEEDFVLISDLAAEDGTTKSTFMKWVKRWAAANDCEVGWAYLPTKSGQRQRCRAVTPDVAEQIRTARKPHYEEGTA